MAEGQAAEPAVGGFDPDVESGSDRTEEEVPVSQSHLAWLAGAAAGEHVALEVVHVVLAEQRQVGLGLGELGGVVEVDRGALGGEHRLPLGIG